MLNYANVLINRSFLIGSLVLLLGLFSNAQIAPKTLKKPSGVGKDTLFVSIANNEKIDIKRTIMGNTKKIVGKKVLEFRSYKIEFKNPKKVALKMKVQDLIPTSKDGQVELEILESSDAEIDFTRGRLAWNFRLKPKEKKVLEVKYNVTYPKNRIILGIENVLQLQANIRKTV
jgi:Domain of unknown function (DUF4139)